MAAVDPAPEKRVSKSVPMSMGFRILQATLHSLEWVGPPGEESCLACGSGRRLGHHIGCLVGSAIPARMGLDAMDGAIGEGVFLTAHQRHSLLGCIRAVTRKLDGLRCRVARIEEFLPRA